MSEAADKHMYYRVRSLPARIDAARRKLAALENEARRFGLHDLVAHPISECLPRGGGSKGHAYERACILGGG